MDTIQREARFTAHLAKQFRRRFPGHDIATAYAEAVPTTYRILRHSYYVNRLSRHKECVYYVNIRMSALFVVVSSDGRGGEHIGTWVVVTVFPLTPLPDGTEEKG